MYQLEFPALILVNFLINWNIPSWLISKVGIFGVPSTIPTIACVAFDLFISQLVNERIWNEVSVGQGRNAH